MLVIAKLMAEYFLMINKFISALFYCGLQTSDSR